MQTCMQDKSIVDAVEYIADRLYAWPGGYSMGIITAGDLQQGKPCCFKDFT